MMNRTPPDRVHGQALAATMASLAAELDLLRLEVERDPSAVAGSFLFENGWHQASQALAALDEAVEPASFVELRVAA